MSEKVGDGGGGGAGGSACREEGVRAKHGVGDDNTGAKRQKLGVLQRVVDACKRAAVLHNPRRACPASLP